MRVKYSELQCCVDCVLYLANGDIPEDRPDLADEIQAQWPHDNDMVLTGCDGEEFSYAPCDCCGSKLGGARHMFAVLEP